MSGLPNLSDALDGLMQPVTAELVEKTIVNGRIQEIVQKTVYTQAVKQPFTARQLSIRPEGERAWPWFTVHIKTNFVLKIDQVFRLSGVQFRVMEVLNYAEYGYMQYSVVQDYNNEAPTC